MNNDKFGQTISDLRKCQDAVLEAKGPDYSERGDRLSNFKDVGRIVRTTCPACGHNYPVGKLVVWAVYACKQIMAVLNWAGGKSLQSETITERFTDLSNYAYLGYGLYREDIEKPTTNIGAAKEEDVGSQRVSR
jgi:hypothetical protein